jgi:dihydroorotase
MPLLIKNAYIVNPDKISGAPQDILLDKGLIAKVGRSLKGEGAKTLDAKGKMALPGLIDIHVHLREPGREDKETIESGSRAAVRGGFTTILCMPNTNPVIDNAMLVEGVIKEAQRVGLVKVVPIGAITKGQRGEELTDMFELKAAGCLAVSDDGHSVQNAKLLRLSLEYAQMAGLLVIEHCQDPLLSGEGVMNEGFISTILGFKGDPSISETVIVARNIEIARYLKIKIHLAHISCERSVELIRMAKKQDIPITAEASPHHFSLNDEAVRTFDPNTKVNPPLRTQESVDAVKRGLQDGTIDCIASDHAPHTQEDKEVGFDDAPFGITGLETSLGLAMTELYHKGLLTLPQIAEKMSAAPARIVGLENKGMIAEGYDADLTIIDPEKKWVVRKEEFESKSKNSPFIGMELTGRVENTVFNGKVVYQKR